MPNPDPCISTPAELTEWARRRGLVVIDTARHEQLCAAAAALIATKDLDNDIAALLGHKSG